MDVKYLTHEIVAAIHQPAPNPNAGITADGYTSIKGAPTQFMIMVEGKAIWRRVWVLCFSNCASHFVTVEGEKYYLTGGDMDKIESLVALSAIK